MVNCMVRVTDFSTDEYIQGSLLDPRNISKKQALDSAIDRIRVKYGNSAILRTVLADGEFHSMTGCSGAEDYPVMSSIL